MYLYHYTSNQLLPKIEKEGLTKGAVPWSMDEQGKVRMMTGLQWLTVDEDFASQSWVPQFGMIGSVMRKNDWRITIEIPDLAAGFVMSWAKFAEVHKLHRVHEEYMRHFPGHQHWRVYRGTIPRAWFVERMKNPQHRQLIDLENN